MDALEIRLRCIEAAAKNPDARHKDGLAAGVLEQAERWYAWIVTDKQPETKGVSGLL